MYPKTKKNSFYLISLFFYLVTLAQISLAQQNKDQEKGDNKNSASSKIYGEFTLTTNSIEQGYSTSNSSFAMQPELGYVWPQAKIGVWGSNVQFPSNTESLNLRLFGWYQFVFSPNTAEMKIRYDMSKYFKANDKDGNIFTIDFNLWSHHAIIQQNSNFLGTATSSMWLAYYKEWKIVWNIDYKLEAGYNMVSASGYSGYFAIKTGVGYKYSDLYYDLLMNYNSASSQFANGIADLAFLFQLSAKF